MSKKYQIGTPIRRRHTVTSADWLTGSEGINVENTAYLHFSSGTKSPRLLVEARLDNNTWVKLPLKVNGDAHVIADVSAWEFVRYSSLSTGQIIHVFGTDVSVENQHITVSQDIRDYNISVENQEILINIHDQLEKMNQYMQIITGEKL